MAKLRSILGTAAAGALLASPLAAAPLFPDVPDTHWARDAVAALAAKGLVEGYPDGTFKGDRAASRWEVAMIVARLLAKMEQEHATFATKAELEELRKLVMAMREELDALGVRVGNLEESTSRLDKRVTELERIRFYGRLHTIGVVNSLSAVGPLDATIGTAANPGIDWSTGRLLIEGQGYTAAATLGLNVKVSDDFQAGGEFVAYTAQGSIGVDSYWGISAPFSANIWTARGNGNGVPGMEPDNNQPFSRMVLDNFWIRHKPSDTRLVIGSYYPRYMPGFVLLGPRNPGFQRPRYLSFNGADVSGPIGGDDSRFKYEVLYTLLPELSTFLTHSFGGTLRYEFENNKGLVGLSVVRTTNERFNDGTVFGSGLVPLPAVPFTGPGAPPVSTAAWLDPRTGLVRTFVGPQEEVTVGLQANGMVWDEAKLRLFGEFSHSEYDPDRLQTLFNTSVGGNLYRFGVSAEPIDNLDLSLEYLRVDPTYDSFILAYPVSPAVPVFLPYGTYYSAYYQLHDYLNYPNNRQGVRFAGNYAFNDKKTSVFLNYSNLNQVAATTPGQVLTVGNIEPLFPVLQAGGAQRGRVESVGVGFRHEFENKFRLGGDYYRYQISRTAPAIDSVSLTENIYKLSGSYPVLDDLDIRGGIWFLDYRGNSGVLATSFSQVIPNLGLDFKLARDTRMSLDYRYMDLNQRAFAGGSYQAHQFMAEVKLDF
ncbi:MAG: S-layer homology domain-containing protein [Candidatus Eremiobacterota bacterium]